MEKMSKEELRKWLEDCGFKFKSDETEEKITLENLLKFPE